MGSSMQGPWCSSPGPGAATLDSAADRGKSGGESAFVIPDSPLAAHSRRSSPSFHSPGQRSPRAQQPPSPIELPRAAEIVAGVAAAAAAATLAQHHLQVVLDSPAGTLLSSPSHSSPPCSPHSQSGSRYSPQQWGPQPSQAPRRCSSGEFVLLRTPRLLSEEEEKVEAAEGGSPGRQQYQQQQQFGTPGAAEGITSSSRRPPSPLGRPQPAAAGAAVPAPAFQAKPYPSAPTALSPTAAPAASSGRLSPASLKLLRLKAELADRRQQQQGKERNPCVSAESSEEEEGEEGVAEALSGIGLGPRRRTGRGSAASRLTGGSPMDSPRISSRVYGAAVQPGCEGERGARR